ncbi:hypothetical protein VP01_349g1 [Puccinia sorghi]|uniref:Uncharacterized protein n=1 Tax=Puccinia sorghi TaxID=27349 RepID=A0A0L6UVN9_9BASI|nr:hypothetical protein VP01_349g1 [Puccinia sorghi]
MSLQRMPPPASVDERRRPAPALVGDTYSLEELEAMTNDQRLSVTANPKFWLKGTDTPLETGGRDGHAEAAAEATDQLRRLKVEADEMDLDGPSPQPHG